MRRSLVGPLLLLGLCAGCKEEDDGNAPPLGKSTTGVISGSGASMSGTGGTDPTNPTLPTSTGPLPPTSGTGGTGSTTNIPPPTSGTGETGLPPPDELLAGQFFNELGERYTLPVICAIRFHAPGEIEPSSGISQGFTLQQSFTISAWPHEWVVTPELAAGVIGPGDTGYVTAVCDTDGDGLTDDNVGGYHPGLPLELIEVPATGLDMEIDPQ